MDRVGGEVGGGGAQNGGTSRQVGREEHSGIGRGAVLWIEEAEIEE